VIQSIAADHDQVTLIGSLGFFVQTAVRRLY
jgi:hypothetical protein